MSDRDEWHADVAGMTETDRYLAIEEPRRAIGVCGDAEDER